VLPPEEDLAWTPPPPGSRLRGWLTLPFAALAAFLIAGLAALELLLLPGRFRRRRVAWIHFWGRTLFAMMGIRLEVHGRENLPEDVPLLLLFDHVGLVDMMVLACLWNERSTVVHKREFHRIPVLGFVMKRLDLVAIDRSNRAEAIRALERVAEIVRERRAWVWMAPEGTRSRDGRLGPFKMGPFHLAVATHAPIVPVLLRGIEVVNPGGGLQVRSGTIRVDFLHPIPTDGYDQDHVRDLADRVRRVFLRWLPDRCSDEGTAAAA